MSDVRIDKWLWAARFYKMRNLATDAVKGGHILINGVRCKPSKTVALHDEIQIQKESELYIVVVSDLASKRGSAKIAQKLYQETEAGLKHRKQAAEQQKFQSYNAPSPQKRPDKQARRKITQFKHSQF